MEISLQAQGLGKSYGRVHALDGFNLQLPKGRIIGLLGPNGSGKTTFLKLCAGLLTPTTGDLRICGQQVGIETKSLVSYLPDRTYLADRQTVAEQLSYFEDFYADFDRPRAEAMLADLGIDPKRRFGTLSKGAKEKVQLVLVMSRRAQLYLLDEPIGGVDPAARDYILETMVRNYAPEATMIISTHLIADVEAVLDDFVFIHQGHVVMAGVAEDARRAHNKTLDELFREVFRCLPSC